MVLVHVTFESGDLNGQRVELEVHRDDYIGRSAECALQVPDATIARRHVKIERHSGTIRLVDLGSTNGMIAVDADGYAERRDYIWVDDSQTVLIGQVRLRFELDFSDALPPESHRELLEGIRADPSAEARLVYADWLTDHGDPQRGELILLQHEQLDLEAQPEDDWDEDRQMEVDARVGQLFRENRARWNRHLVGARDWTYRAGFVHALEINPQVLAARGDVILAHEPAIARLTLDMSPNSTEPLRALVGHESLRNLEFLSLKGYASVAEAAMVFSVRGWPSLHTIMGAVRYTNTAAESLPCVRALANNEHLALKCLKMPIHIDDGGAMLIAQSPHLQQLERLMLGNTSLTTKGLRALAEMPNLVELGTNMLRRIPSRTPEWLEAGKILDIVKRRAEKRAEDEWTKRRRTD